MSGAVELIIVAGAGDLFPGDLARALDGTLGATHEAILDLVVVERLSDGGLLTRERSALDGRTAAAFAMAPDAALPLLAPEDITALSAPLAAGASAVVLVVRPEAADAVRRAAASVRGEVLDALHVPPNVLEQVERARSVIPPDPDGAGGVAPLATTRRGPGILSEMARRAATDGTAADPVSGRAVTGTPQADQAALAAQAPVRPLEEHLDAMAQAPSAAPLEGRPAGHPATLPVATLHQEGLRSDEELSAERTRLLEG